MSGGQLAFPGVRTPLYGDGERYVREANRAEVDWMIRKHYLGKWPGVVVSILGMFRCDIPVGVVVFSLPPVETFARYGGLTWELGRLWISDDEPRNSESWLIGKSVRYVRRYHPDVVALVSYADPSVGHQGVIYRASNWLPDGMTDEGRSTPRFDYKALGKKFSRKAHVPAGAEVERVPRVSKHRYWLPLTKRVPRLTGGLGVAGTPPAQAPSGVAGQVYDPFGDALAQLTRDENPETRYPPYDDVGAP